MGLLPSLPVPVSVDDALVVPRAAEVGSPQAEVADAVSGGVPVAGLEPEAPRVGVAGVQGVVGQVDVGVARLAIDRERLRPVAGGGAVLAVVAFRIIKTRRFGVEESQEVPTILLALINF